MWALAALTAATLLLSDISALATPTLGDRRAQAERARAQVEALDEKVEIAAEDYNEASARYREVSAKASAAEARLAKVAATLAKLRARLGDRATFMYRSGPLSFLEVLLGTNDFAEFATVWDLLAEMNREDASMVAELRTAKAEAQQARADLATAREQAKSELATMKARKKQIEGQLAERKRVLRGLEGEIARIEAERQAAAPKKRRWRLPDISFGGKPERQPRSEVVNIAKRYMGVPYRWGGSSPSEGFDCSGFTMYVYAQVGVRLPHSSRAQIGVGERVARAHLEPGDLVFFGRSRIHHVGIYVGGDSYIHSPRTGDVVKISSLSSRGDFAGACRP